MPNLNPAQVLSQYQPPDQPNSAVVPLGNAGGASGSDLFRYTARDGSDLVLKAWPIEQSTLRRVKQVHTWIDHVSDLEFIPRLRRSKEGSTVALTQGRCWEVATWMPGSPATTGSPTPEHVETVLINLAKLHLRWASLGVRLEKSPGLKARVEEIRQLGSGELAQLQKIVTSQKDSVVRTTAQSWLEAAGRLDFRKYASTELDELYIQPCLRDARPEHFLFRDDRITGLIDFGAMDVDSVVADLSRLILEWFENDRTLYDFALKAYERVRLLSERESHALRSFEVTSRILSGARWIRWAFVDGRVFDDPLALERGLKTALGRLRSL